MLEHYESIIEEKLEKEEKLLRCIFCNRVEIEPDTWVTLHRDLEKRSQKIFISGICPDDERL
jgi:hypothetical protein